MPALRRLRGLLLFIALASPSAAEDEGERLLYSWTSEDGGVHYTDDLSRVPEKFRANPRIFVAKERSAATPASTPATPQPPPTPASKAADVESYDGWTEMEWRDAAARLDGQLASLAPVVAECAGDHVNLSPGDGSRKRREEEAEARRCAEARASYGQATAEREALSERAHRAGAPPGWVRPAD
jgi:hypothetical protein